MASASGRDLLPCSAAVLPLVGGRGLLAAVPKAQLQGDKKKRKCCKQKVTISIFKVTVAVACEVSEMLLGECVSGQNKVIFVKI